MPAIWSEHWHAVCKLQPRLRDGVQVVHRRLRGRPWVLLIDPLSQRFHRMSPAVWKVLQLMDGRRTLDHIWHAVCAVPADAAGQAEHLAMSQNDLVQLMASLHGSDLLQSQVTPDAGEVFERWQRQDGARIKQSWMNPLSIRVPLLYPDAWFTRQAGLAHAVVSWPFLALWLCLVVPAAVLAFQHWTALNENLSDRVLSASNLLLLWFIYPVVKAVHECAHGLAVKAFGGHVREIGVMFMIFMPVPYVDATSSYGFPSKWARITVAAAGIMAELLLGAIALLVWLLAEPGLVTAMAFNVVLIAGVSTLLINGNPLMRYDGYFIACDLLESPNLGQRSTQYLVYLLDRWGFGARDAKPPLQAHDERLLLLSYGVVSPIYRLFITFGIVWFVAAEYMFIGVVMALFALWGAVVLPLWKGWKHLRRGTALRRTALASLVLALLVGAVPLPFHSVHHAVVWVPDEAIVRAESAGTVSKAGITRGSAVQPGQTLIELDSPTLVAEMSVAAAALARVQAELRRAEVQDKAKAAALSGELQARTAKLKDAQQRMAGLQVRANPGATGGAWIPHADTELPGRYVRRGEVLGHVVAAPSPVLRAAIAQEDMDLIRSRLQGVQARLAQDLAHPVGARLVRQVPGGEFELVSSALGTAGGGEIAVDPSKPGGTHTLKRVFDVELRLERPSPRATFGDRAHVRFDLGLAPIGWQWFLRLRQLFLARLSV